MHPLTRYRLKKLVRGVVPYGLAARRDMEGVARHLRALGFVPSLIIDVGVANGTYELYRTWPRAPLLLLEPVPAYAATCAQIVGARRDGSRFIAGAAGDSDGEIELFFGDDLQGASILPGQARSLRVPLHRLDSIVGETGGAILLKIDVQGAEGKVLDGAVATLRQCAVVMLETQLHDLAGTGTTIGEMIARMKGLGFVPFDIYDGILRPSDRSLGQVDIAFIRVDSPWRSSEWATAAQKRRSGPVYRLRQRLGIDA